MKEKSLNKSEKYLAGKRVTVIGAATNLLLSILKLAAGIFGRSEALIADAVHSLSDLVSDVVVLVSLKVSQKPVDESRPYGYGKVETVGTGLLGLILIAVAVGMFWDAVKSINEGVSSVPTGVALAGAFFSILANELLFRYSIKVGRRVHSPSVIANAWHHRSDALSSLAALAGAGTAMMGWPIFDPIAALIVTVLIFKVGWEIISESFKDIIDTAVKKEIRDQIINAAISTEGAIGCHDLKTRKMGSDILVDIHVEVDAKLNISDAHNIADAVRDNIVEKVAHITDVLVHLDPGDDSDKMVYTLPEKEIMEEVARRAGSVDGVIGWGEINFKYDDESLIVNLSVILKPELTISEGYVR
jgi:cation diffusion facilitator family transporter